MRLETAIYFSLIALFLSVFFLTGCSTNPQQSRGCYSEMAHSWCRGVK